ncbi:HNH endonuclease, partial [Dysosmobacter welbionis]
VLVILDQDGGIVVETDIGAVRPADALGAADDHGLDDLALLHRAAGGGLADGRDDHIADVAELPLGAAQDTDALDLLGAGIIGHLQ